MPGNASLHHVYLDSAAATTANSEDGLRPKSFLHDEMNEFNQIFAELVHSKRPLSDKNLPFVNDMAVSSTITALDSDLSCTVNLCDTNYVACTSCCCTNVVKSFTDNQLLPLSSHSQSFLTASNDDQCHEDDNDSGYQSGNNTLVASVNQTLSHLQSSISQCYFDPGSTLKSNSCIDEGFIRVQMNLNQPINMALNSVADVTSSCNRIADVESFYLPETVIVIHIASNMTTTEVVQTLLDKYTITDSCNKFALYEKTTNTSENICDGQQYRDTFRRLRNDEYPLELWLHWTEDIDSHQFVLRDNITSDIVWDAFSVPELEAFLNILEHEESAYVKKITHKFISLKTAAIQRLKQMNNY